MYRAVALFDLDKTLLNDEKNIPEENLAALAALRAGGVLPALATGRNHYELLAMMAEAGVETAVEANGAAVFFKARHILETPLPQGQIAALVAQAEQDGIAIAFYNNRGVALTRATAETQTHYREFIRKPQPRQQLDFYLTAPVLMMVIFIPDTSQGNQLAARYRQQFPALNFYRNAPLTLDVVAKGINKATGLAALMAQPELQGLPTYAFGDGNNDIEMLQSATTGIAMGNALPQVAAVADYQTADYRHGGIVKALKHFALI
ncbi:MAG: Cof-type HAD-IIB family hydrolase [Lactobacillus sp.]|jgi:Cof subfamily protein (haloacid dehalogenase superfamily)|nr:Cof-type HAD-IIB family hydrolase [Lactobacillus sp.]MCI2032449.1 Cof-type HAD-IIB family hydrolase [Lactobacillus sp.]